jgi:CRISPR/Cas system-associated exonuclease Cas4 (RecB family)
MTLPNGFLFSQSNLQDFDDCQRRFQLRHLIQLAWPAIEAEPALENEQIMDQGARFHRIVRQHLLGVPEQQISLSIGDDELMCTWWDTYLHATKEGSLSFIFQEGNQRFPEISLSTALGEYRLIAKYDLLVLHPEGKLTIIDWKTSQTHPKRKWLADRMQTHVYSYLLTQAASSLNKGRQIDPDHIEMIYWFTTQPDQLDRFPYNNSANKADIDYLLSMVKIIKEKKEPDFPLTQDIKRCLFCTYRSLCNRGVEPGNVNVMEQWQEADEPYELTFDYDQIGEIEY